MTATIVGSPTTTTGGTSTTLAVNLPASPTVGNLLVMTIGFWADLPATPTGWTLLVSSAEGQSSRTAAFTRVVNGGEGSTVTLTGWYGEDARTAVVVELADHNGVDVSAASNSTSAAILAPTVTTTVADCLLIMASWAQVTQGQSGAFADYATGTTLTKIQSAPFSGWTAIHALGYRTQVSAGASGTDAITTTGTGLSSSASSLTIAIAAGTVSAGGEGTASGTVGWAGTAQGPQPIALRGDGSFTGTTVTTMNPSVSALAQTGDLSVLAVCVKPYNATITTPSTWTKIGEVTDGGTIAASAADLGSMKVCVYVKESATPGAIGAIGQSSANSISADIKTYSKDPTATWDFSAWTTGGQATKVANFAATGAAGLNVAAGDHVLACIAANSDLGTPTAHTIGGMAGATLGTVTATELGSTMGFDLSSSFVRRPVTAGSSNAAPTASYTNSSTASGAVIFLRLRQVLPASDDRTATGALALSLSPAGTAVAISISDLTASLVDDFSGTLSTLWPVANSASIVGGRARITCNTGYNGIYSAAIYDLTGSSVMARVYAPAAGGATTAIVDMKVDEGAGTQIQIELDMVTGLLNFRNSTGYSDPNNVTLAYNPVTHAWWRIREASGVLYWETSPDGVTWTNRRTTNTATPAWVGDGQNKVAFTAHRDAGVNDYTEIDNVNVAPLDSRTATGALALGVTAAGSAVKAGSAAGALALSLTQTGIVAIPGGGGTTYLTEPFTGTDGTSWGANWVLAAASTAATATKQGNQGQLYTGSNAGYAGHSGQRWAGGVLGDVDVSGKLTFPSVAIDGTQSIIVRGDATASGNNGYYLTIKPGSGALELFKTVAFAYTSLDTDTLTITAGAVYGWRIQAIGSAVKARVWLFSGGEPSTWQFEVTDTSLTTGYVVIDGTGGGAGGMTTLLDDIVITDGAVSDDRTATGTLSLGLGRTGVATKAGVGTGTLGLGLVTPGVEAKAGVVTGALSLSVAATATDAKTGGAAGSLALTMTAVGTGVNPENAGLNAATRAIGVNAMQDAAGWLSIHTAQPDAVGSNAASSARIAAGWPVVSDEAFGALGTRAFTGGTPGAQALFLGFWSAPTGGVFRGWIPIAGDQRFNSDGQFALTYTP